MKRFFDFSAATLGIIVVAPITISTAIVVKKKIGSPILFTQTRPGQYGKPFQVYKFRTMTNETDENGKLLSDADRLTETGKFLRKYSLDELPQLINVIKGDISLVGPRPLLMEYNDLYNDEQRRRLDVKPGITGWAQVNGRNALSWEEKFKLDVWYVDNQSLLLDMYILYLTLYKVVKPEGINNSNETTMPLFEGTEIHRR
ncbi:sugar transferase [Macrococcoides caseolyticum]|uniref:sugar transferase n=1 Tax=Macrococcoides caseolyticum TaxID=69966 RepID=UPI00105E7FF8|nr:sugar transferase [Macrococcus caseolyticus]TDM19514.1 sugar transferase [Macrococcus caseolyticus]VUC67809.1 capsular polysaccharide synthesis enzyme Cap5M [Macrococcus caseolyticus]